MSTALPARRIISSTLVVVALLGSALDAGAQTNTPRPEDQAAPPSPSPPYVFGGYVEALYQWNFNQPSNGITNFRGFDNRHNSFTLSNVALDGQWDVKNVTGRITLQIGHTPNTYYAAEPTRAGASGANGTGAELWKYIQQAYVGYRIPVGRGLLAQAGVFLSPIGPESMAVRDNWNWSRSNLFFGLPFYHTGIRLSYPLTDEWTVALWGINGWNSVVDNNDEKSIMLHVSYTKPGKLALSMLGFAGVERPAGAPEGRAWRYSLDMHATWDVTPRVSLLGHVNGGAEPNQFGRSAWVAGALGARVKVLDRLYLAGRGDAFYEQVASNAQGEAASIFWPVDWVASATATMDVRPHEQLSVRLEYRHDQAAGNMYFGGIVDGNGESAPFVTNRRSQDTLMLGATAWF